MSKRILVVDDDPPITKGIEMVLNNAGYTTKITLKGEETRDLVNSFKPNLILMDAMLAGLDGREIAKDLKNDPETSAIPIILISANQYMGQDFASFGIESFIAKPFSSAHLLKIVDKYTNAVPLAK